MINFPGPEKLLMLAVIALVVIGPTRLPSAARTAGKWVAELRKLTSRFHEEISGALGEPKDAITSAIGDLHKEVGGWRNDVAGMTRTLTSSVTGAAAVVGSAESGNGTSAANGGTTTSPGSTARTARYDPAAVASRPGPSGFGQPGQDLPVLPPAPDDPSLN